LAHSPGTVTFVALSTASRSYQQYLFEGVRVCGCGTSEFDHARNFLMDMDWGPDIVGVCHLLAENRERGKAG